MSRSREAISAHTVAELNRVWDVAPSRHADALLTQWLTGRPVQGSRPSSPPAAGGSWFSIDARLHVFLAKATILQTPEEKP